MGEGSGRAVELAREQAHLDLVHARLDELRAAASASERDALGLDLDGTPQGIYERDVTAFHAAARRQVLEVPDEGAVFGRLDRLGGDVLRVGRLGVRTPDQEPLVVDWRAPAAAPFYQATMASPQGVVRRRSVSCRGRSVTGVEDELLDLDAASSLEGSVVGEGAFFDLLSRERSGHMRDIVATIQADQDRAVRSPDDGALLVTGGPGTGKTAVALHRVAYLMYQRRELYSRRGVLVVGPTPTFVEYVSHVLPSLGESSVAMHSLASLPELPPGFSVAGRDLPDVERVKGSASMAKLLRRVVSHLGTSGPPSDVELSWRGAPFVLESGALSRRRAALARSSRPHNLARSALASSVLELAWESWSASAPFELDESDREGLLEGLGSDVRLSALLDRLWPILDPVDVWDALVSGSLPLRRLGRSLVPESDLELLSSSWDPSGRTVTVADAALLDELVSLLGPVPVPVPEDLEPDLDYEGYAELSTFSDRLSPSRSPAQDEVRRSPAALVVDEVQDVTPMQWRMVARAGRGAHSWTLVGDFAQTSWHDPAEVRAAMEEAVGRRALAALRTVELQVNYRTSTEVALLAARVLEAVDPVAVPPRAVRTTDVEPEERLGDPLSLVEGSVLDLLRQVSGTVSVVSPPALVGSVRSRLSALLATHERLFVVDTWEAKGLEYDAVSVLDPARIVSDGASRAAGLRSLYVAVSRGAHQLHLLSEVPLDEVLAVR